MARFTEKQVPKVSMFNGEYLSLRDQITERERQTPVLPRVNMYLLEEQTGRERFLDALGRYGDKVLAADDLTYWALDAGLLVDSLPHQLEDAVKTGVLGQDGINDYLGAVAEFSWKTDGRFVRVLNREDFYNTAFSRNAHLWSNEVQGRIRSTKFGIAGLGVGTSVGYLLALTGAEDFLVADGGAQDLHDHNRLLGADVAEIGQNQAVRWARLVYEQNPYVSIDARPQNLGTGERLVPVDEFVAGSEIPIEAVDSLEVKLGMRIAAKLMGKDVAMATDTGIAGVTHWEGSKDGIFFDRWTGALQLELMEAVRNGQLTQELKTKIATAMVGPDNIPDYYRRALAEAAQAGATFWPQPGIAAFTSAAGLVAKIIMSFEGAQFDQETVIDLRQLSFKK